MEQNAKQLVELFEAEKKEFDLASEKYRKAFRQFKPLSILESLPTPPVHRAAYSDRMAWILAHMAKLAYIKFEESDLEVERLEHCLASGWFNLIKTFNKNGTQAFLAKNDEFVVLSFRGTQPDKWEDVRTDLRVLKLKTIDGKVHIGFKNAFDDVKDAIVNELRMHKGEMPLYITGHSLGAALATVAVQEIDEEFHDQVAACYTFGSPRVGDGKYEKAIKVPFYRIVNATDIVTLIPFFLGSFVHVGDTRYLSRRKVNDVYVLYRGMPSFTRLLESILETLLAIVRLSNPLGPWISAHSMDVYIDKLERCARARNVTAR
jgi:triacylglycerol lipase